MIRIAVFASGEGTNAENLIRYFSGRAEARVVLVVYNRREAPVRERAARLGTESVYVPKSALDDASSVLSLLRDRHIDVLVLAGFLLLVPPYLLDAYPGRVVNIHPSLLPRHGGKGMYGERVHQAVLESGEAESGITIHLVDRDYDRGRVLRQVKCSVYPDDTPHSLAERVHELEYRYYPEAVETLCRSLLPAEETENHSEKS